MVNHCYARPKYIEIWLGWLGILKILLFLAENTSNQSWLEFSTFSY